MIAENAKQEKILYNAMRIGIKTESSQGLLDYMTFDQFNR
jgi:hypothetical protein